MEIPPATTTPLMVVSISGLEVLATLPAKRISAPTAEIASAASTSADATVNPVKPTAAPITAPPSAYSSSWEEMKDAAVPADISMNR